MYALNGWLGRVQAGQSMTATYVPLAYGGLPPGRSQTGEPRRPDDLIADLRLLTEEPVERKAVA